MNNGPTCFYTIGQPEREVRRADLCVCEGKPLEKPHTDPPRAAVWNPDGPRIVALFGSPHPDGPTARLLAELLREAPTDAATRVVSVFSEPAAPCDDCRACDTVPGCVKNRSGDLFEAVERADFLIVATPVYLLSFPAPLKAVFDRFQQYYCARFRRGLKPAVARPKRAFLLLTQGSDSDEGPRFVRRQCERAFSVMNTRLTGEYVLAGTDGPDAGRFEAARAAVREKARAFFTEPD